MKLQDNIHDHFLSCKNPEEIYHKIIALGQQLPSFNPLWKIEENRVLGCQSIMYLHSEETEPQCLTFYADSDALISKGLAALLIAFYNGKTAEWILKNPPTFLEELKITQSLTPGRSNGLASLYNTIKQRAFKAIIKAFNDSKQ